MPEPSANTHVPQERSQARVEEELIPPSAFESREVNTPMLLREVVQLVMPMRELVA